jgi:hypothetical protein
MASMTCAQTIRVSCAARSDPPSRSARYGRVAISEQPTEPARARSRGTSAATTFGFTASTNPLTGNQLGLSAVLTGGPMAGDSGTAAPIIVSQDGLCLFGGVGSLSLILGAIAFTH